MDGIFTAISENIQTYVLDQSGVGSYLAKPKFHYHDMTQLVRDYSQTRQKSRNFLVTFPWGL